MTEWYADNVGADWEDLRKETMRLLQEEAGLEEIVSLVGIDALSQKDRLTLETAKAIREDYLHQNAFHEIDTYASLEKQKRMLNLILDFHKLGVDALYKNVDIEDIMELSVREKIGRSKYIEESKMTEFDEIEKEMKKQFGGLSGAEAE